MKNTQNTYQNVFSVSQILSVYRVKRILNELRAPPCPPGAPGIRQWYVQLEMSGKVRGIEFAEGNTRAGRKEVMARRWRGSGSQSVTQFSVARSQSSSSVVVRGPGPRLEQIYATHMRQGV